MRQRLRKGTLEHMRAACAFALSGRDRHFSLAKYRDLINDTGLIRPFLIRRVAVQNSLVPLILEIVKILNFVINQRAILSLVS